MRVAADWKGPLAKAIAYVVVYTTAFVCALAAGAMKYFWSDGGWLAAAIIVVAWIVFMVRTGRWRRPTKDGG